MKINIKSNKGVTVTGLVIYVGSFLMICAVIGVITTFFYNNTKFLSSEATASAEYDVLNAYLAKEAKTEGNKVILEDDETIKFTNGNQYIFEKEIDADYGQIYLYNGVTKKYFIVANYIQKSIDPDTNTEKNIFEKVNESFILNIKILGKNYSQTYNLAD